MGGSARKSAAEAQAVLHSMLLTDLHYSPRSLTDLFYWYGKFTFINEPQTHISSKHKKRSHWGVTKWKGYDESEAGTGKESKGCPGIPPPHGFRKGCRQPGNQGERPSSQQGKGQQVLEVWYGPRYQTISPEKHSSTLTEVLSLPLFPCVHGRQAAWKCRALKFFDLWQANSPSQWLICWDPICLGSSKFLLLRKTLSSFSERQPQGSDSSSP